MVINQSECGWLVDAASMGKARAWLAYLSKSNDLSESIRADIKKLVDDLEKINCAMYTKD